MEHLPEIAPPSIDDISPRKLGEELGISHYEYPAEDMHMAIRVFGRINQIIKKYPRNPKENMLEFLQDNKQDLFTLFDEFNHSYRFPVYLTRQLYDNVSVMDPDLYSTAIDCWRWYACLKSIELDTSFFQKRGVFILPLFVSGEGTRMLLGAWGRKYQTWVSALGGQDDFLEAIKVRERERKVFSESLNLSQKDVNDIQQGLRDFFQSVEQSFEVLLLQHQAIRNHPKVKIPALNFLLCQKDMYGYASFVRETIKSKSDAIVECLPVWSEWIRRYYQDIIKEDSEIRKIFYFVFELEGNLFEGGKISQRLRRKFNGRTQGIPKELCEVFEELYRDDQKKERESIKNTKKSVGKKIHTKLSLPSQPVVRPIKAEKEKIDMPSANSLFVSGGEGEQLKAISFPEKYLHAGTIVILERRIGGKKENTFPLKHEGVTDIPVVENLQGDLRFSYVVRITLPKSQIFVNGESDITLLPYNVYVKAPKKLEIARPVVRVREEWKTVSVMTPTVQTKVVSVLETPTLPKQKTLADTLTAWEIAVEDDSITPELRDDGVVIFRLPDEFIDDLHDASFEVLKISPDGTMNPDIGGGNIASQIQDIARELRGKREEAQKLALQAEQEEKEYQTLREQFQPFYDFIGVQTFVDKNSKVLFDKASEGFKSSLKSLGWSMPWRITKDGQIQFRHIRNDIKITYSNLGIAMHVVGEKRTLSGAEERCYREIAEAFSHLALFYTAEYRERQKMISKEKKFQKDMRQGAEAYEELLREGKARLVQYYSGGKGGIFVTKFPLDDRPHMLPEKVGRDTVEEALQKNEHSELCYRRDILRINGEIDENAEEQSIENALQNLNDLRQSPRARYILRKRILITLGYEKFSGDDTRRAIQTEKNGRKKTSAYEILQSLKIEKNIESKEQIDEEFMDSYIDLLIKYRIRVQYVWPLSVSLKTHREQL